MATTSKKSSAAAAPAKKPAAKAAPASKPAAAKPAAKAAAKPAAKKAAAPKAAAPKKATAAKVSKPAAPPSPKRKNVSPEERYHMIATAAYFMAEQRGFAGGYEMDDWIRGEAQIDAMLNA